VVTECRDFSGITNCNLSGSGGKRVGPFPFASTLRQSLGERRAKAKVNSNIATKKFQTFTAESVRTIDLQGHVVVILDHNQLRVRKRSVINCHHPSVIRVDQINAKQVYFVCVCAIKTRTPTAISFFRCRKRNLAVFAKQKAIHDRAILNHYFVPRAICEK